MKIAGIAACVPKHVVETKDAAKHFPEHDVSRIIKNTGVERKREASEGTTVSKLCIEAASDLLDGLGWERDSVDAVVLFTTLADHFLPATAHKAQQQLGLPDRCLVFDVNLGCSAYTHGLIMLEGLLASGLIKRALLLCGEMTVDTFRPRLHKARHRSDLANSILFGDAGTATAVTSEGETQVVARQFGADGKGVESIIVHGGAGASFWSPELFERKPHEDGFDRRDIDLILRGPEVLTFTMKRVPKLMKDLLGQADWTVDDVDAVVPHQANKFMIDFLAKRMKVPQEKLLFSITEFGNTSSASIPLTMVVSAGEHAKRPTKWGLLGFGVGLSWSGLLLETPDIFIPPLKEIE